MTADPAESFQVGSDSPPSNVIRQLALSLTSDILEIERPDTRRSFAELGGDSIHAVRLVYTLRDELEVLVPLSALLTANSMDDFVQRVVDLVHHPTGKTTSGNTTSEPA